MAIPLVIMGENMHKNNTNLLWPTLTELMYLNIPDCHTIPLVQFWKMIRRTNRLEDWVMHWPPGNNNNNENNNIIIRQTTHAIGCHKCHIVVAFLPSIVALWLVEYKDRGKFQVLESGIVIFFCSGGKGKFYCREN